MTRRLALAFAWSGLGALVHSANAADAPRLRLDRAVYRPGDPARATLDAPLAHTDARVVFVSEQGKDMEAVPLPDGATNASAIVVATGPPRIKDGRLQLRPGERFFAMLPYDGEGRRRLAVAMGVAFREDVEAVRIDPRLEQGMLGKDARSGILASPAGVAEIATDHLILHPRDADELTRFLQLTHGEAFHARPRSGGGQGEAPRSVLVRLQLPPAFADLAPQLRAAFGDTSPMRASSPAVAAAYGAALGYRVQGYRVSIDPVMQWQGDFTTTDGGATPDDANFLGGTHALGLLPGMREAWEYFWLWDLTSRRIDVGVIDQGFAPNPDFRGYGTSSIRQCDFADHEPSDPQACATGGWNGIAAAPQTVGNSFFGGRVWHGTGVVTAATGLFNNGWGRAGVAGQIGRPMLYRMDLRSYAVQMADAIRHATDDGASVINISAAIPCRVFSVAAAPYDICNPVGRTQFEHDTIASAIALANATCGPFAFFCVGGLLYAAEDVFSLFLENTTVDIRSDLEEAVAYANAKGVVVVACAGNVLANPYVCTFVDCDNHSADDWNTVPCVLPGVICVGATTSSPTYRNLHFFGSSVDVWAPLNQPYFRPPADDALVDPALGTLVPAQLGGTSASTPVVTGVVALLQAARPDLDPRNPTLSDEQRAAIPGRIRALLVDTATVEEQDGVTMRIVQPFRALRAATADSLPDPVAFAGPDWYLDTPSGAADDCGTDDQVDPSCLASPGTCSWIDGSSAGRCTGSIIRVEPTEAVGTAGASRSDRDVTYWHAPADGRYRTTVRLSTPSQASFGALRIAGRPGTPLGVDPAGDTESFEYDSLPRFADSVTPFTVEGVRGTDNLYRLSFAAGDRLPGLPPDRFDQAATHPLGRPDNDTLANAAPVGRPAAGADAWDWSAAGGGRILLKGLNFHAHGDTDWVRVDDIRARTEAPCGLFLAVSAPDDVEIEIRMGSTLLTGFRRGVATHRVPDLVLQRPDAPEARVYVGFRSASDAALEYDASIGLLPLSPVACRMRDRWGRDDMVFARFPPDPLRIVLATRPLGATTPLTAPVALLIDHASGTLQVTGRLVEGHRVEASLVDTQGRTVSKAAVLLKEDAGVVSGEDRLDLRLDKARRGLYYLVLSGFDDAAELELRLGARR